MRHAAKPLAPRKQIKILLESGGSAEYNKDMLAEFPFSDEWKNDHMVTGLADMVRMNHYLVNWPVVLDALRRLWETGNVSELKSSFYEPFEKPTT